MIRRISTVVAIATVIVSCAGPSSPGGNAVPRTPAERLEAILATPITHHQDSVYTLFAAEQGAILTVLLPGLALNGTADPLARANAVLRMGEREMLDFDTYARTIEDPDPRVRGATLGVVGPLGMRAPDRSLQILARGLVDEEIGIQAKALQELRDRDLEMLHFYLAGNPPPELGEIALQTIRAAHAFGAPLTPEPDGTLRRVTPSGVELVLRPDTAWPQWDAVMGRLVATPVGGGPRTLADSVEAVAMVIPAVVDPSGRYVALETARRIEVHDLETGDVRVVEAGIAPRPLPFTPDFLYFRELDRMRLPDGARLRYELMRGRFEGGAGMPFDTVVIETRADLRGHLSPLRWARIIDHGTRFVVDTDGLRNHVLPTPMHAPVMEEGSR